MPWPQTGINSLQSTVSTLRKGFSIKGLVVGPVVFLGSINEGKGF